MCVCVCLSMCLFVCLSVCLSICLFVYLSVCLSVCLSICMFVCLFVCLSVCLSDKIYSVKRNCLILQLKNICNMLNCRILYHYHCRICYNTSLISILKSTCGNMMTDSNTRYTLITVINFLT